jgi:LmbE family N-acetylglucosaminyl deacetylase
MNVLVIAAHPDDEVLGCGGTVAALAARGHAVAIGILGEGITSRFEQRQQADAASIAELHGHSHKAAALLGARELRLAGLPDNRFDTVALLDVVKIIEQWIREFAPGRVYTQHGGDLNIDHGVTFRATLTATRPLAGGVVKELYAYPVASSTEWAFGRFAPAFRPNVFVDVAATLEQKVAAMAVYESEARPFPHPRAAESLRAAAAHWGAAAGLAAAEPFELVRAIDDGQGKNG